MAQFVTMDQARSFEVGGKTYDLVKRIEELDAVPSGWVSPVGVDELTIGQTVHVWFSGKLRCGVVAKVGRARATVVLITQDAVEEAKLFPGGGAVVKVVDVAVHPDMIHYPAPNMRLVALRESRYEEAKAEDIERSEKPSEEPEECPSCGGPLASDNVCADDMCGTDEEDRPMYPAKRDLKVVAFREARYVEDLRRAESPDSARNHTGSSVIRVLERVWARIRDDHPELPDVVIVTGSGLVESKWGHFRAEGWKIKEEGAAVHRHELFLSGEALAKGADQVLQTMLHEGAHTLARVRGLKDTSRQGRWHNRIFRKTAEEMGLEHRGDKADGKHGYAYVHVTGSTRERYADLVEELDRSITVVCHLPVWMGGSPDDEPGDGERITGKPSREDSATRAKSRNVKAKCRCAEPLVISVKPEVLETQAIRCELCESRFLEV